MAYEKGYLVTQDKCVGTQSVNRVIENNRAIQSAWAAKHNAEAGPLSISLPTNPLYKVGRHNDILIARSVCDFDVVTTGTVTTLAANVPGAIVAVGANSRLDFGYWLLYVGTPQLFGAIATIKADSNTEYKATCRIVQSNAGKWLYVQTWDVSVPERVDIGFSVAVWTQST